MKKFFCLVSSIIIGAVAFAGEKYNVKAAVGFTLPVTVTNYDFETSSNLDIDQIGFGLDLSYLFFKKTNGLTFKLGISFDLINSEQMNEEFEGGGVKKGFCRESELNAGIGYSFIKTDRFTLTALAMFGFGSTTYLYNYGSAELSITHVYFDFGADLDCFFQINNSLGIYGSVGIRYAKSVRGDYRSEIFGISNTQSYSANSFRVIPTFGITLSY